MGKQTDNVIARLNVVTERAVIGLALDIHGGVVEATPVDTGWARANWIPSKGQPKTEAAGTPEQIDSGASTAGVAEVVTWTVSEGPIYVTNNVPYVGRLNAGSSKQAPEGFVESEIRAAVNRANKRRYK
jgi:hypothetical protein